LAFTAITLKILDNLNEAQERAHEQAQAEAATAPVGDTIYWNQSGASGAVSVLRDGYSASGRYCREFQQEVTIGGGTERAYGTACQQADGSWQVVSTDE
jgi:surface antigen